MPLDIFTGTEKYGGTVFGSLYRGAIIPESTDEIVGTWARKMGELQGRLFGWSGSIVVNFGQSALVNRLGPNFFNLNRLPIVWTSVQTGSLTWQKAFWDNTAATSRKAFVSNLGHFTEAAGDFFFFTVNNTMRAGDIGAGTLIWYKVFGE